MKRSYQIPKAPFAEGSHVPGIGKLGKGQQLKEGAATHRAKENVPPSMHPCSPSTRLLPSGKVHEESRMCDRLTDALEELKDKHKGEVWLSHLKPAR